MLYFDKGLSKPILWPILYVCSIVFSSESATTSSGYITVFFVLCKFSKNEFVHKLLLIFFDMFWSYYGAGRKPCNTEGLCGSTFMFDILSLPKEGARLTLDDRLPILCFYSSYIFFSFSSFFLSISILYLFLSLNSNWFPTIFLLTKLLKCYMFFSMSSELCMLICSDRLMLFNAGLTISDVSLVFYFWKVVWVIAGTIVVHLFMLMGELWLFMSRDMLQLLRLILLNCLSVFLTTFITVLTFLAESLPA